MEPADLINVPRLITAYYTDSRTPPCRGSGCSVHRGSSFDNAFNEAHILAITRPSVGTGRQRGFPGHCFWASTAHALSEPALASALEVLAANEVEVMIDAARGYTQHR